MINQNLELDKKIRVFLGYTELLEDMACDIQDLEKINPKSEELEGMRKEFAEITNKQVLLSQDLEREGRNLIDTVAEISAGVNAEVLEIKNQAKKLNNYAKGKANALELLQKKTSNILVNFGMGDKVDKAIISEQGRKAYFSVSKSTYVPEGQQWLIDLREQHPECVKREVSYTADKGEIKKLIAENDGEFMGAKMIESKKMVIK